MRRARLAANPWLLGVATLGGFAAASLLMRLVRRSAGPPLARVSGPLDAVNDDFHEEYDASRRGSTLTYPVFVVLADSLILHRRGKRQEVTYSPRLFHALKSAAHAPVSIYALLHRNDELEREPADLARLRQLRSPIASALDALAKEKEEPQAIENLQEILRASLSLLDNVAVRGRADRAELDAYAKTMGPRLLASTNDATRIQLASLNEKVAELLSGLDAEEQRKFHVVVTGAHQARAHSLAMQYFRALLNEPGPVEHRVLYAEAVEKEEDALLLVGTHRLDNAIAKAFFGDPNRLQRDVLADSARALIPKIELPSLPYSSRTEQ